MSALRLGRREDYARFLAVNAATIPIEQLLESAGIEADLADWSLRARRHALIADMTDLGLTDDPARISDPPDLSEPSARLGLAYVLEGSRLGAAVLRKTACASADPVVRVASRYLRHGEGQDFWRSFLLRLTATAWTPRDHARAADAAAWGFDQYLARTPPLAGEAA